MTSNRERIEFIFDRLNAHDVAAVAEFWTDETIDYFPHGEIVGKAALTQFFGGMVAALPDVSWDVRTIVAEDDTVFIHWLYSGTFSGAPLMGFNPTGDKIEFEGFDKFVFGADGKIKTVHVRYDQMAFARQIGALPEDGTFADRALKALFNFGTRVKRLVRGS